MTFFVVSSIIRIALIATGIYILYRREKINVMKDLGIIALLIGFYELYLVVTILIPSRLDVKDVIDFVVLGMLILTALIDLFIIILSARFIKGHRRNAIRLAICFAIPLIMMICVILYNIPNLDRGFDYAYGIIGQYTSTSVVYALLFIILIHPNVRDEPSEWKVYALSNSKYESFNIEPESSIYRRNLLEFMHEIEEPVKWKDSEVIPGMKECVLEFGLYKKYQLTIRKSDDSDILRASILAVGTEEYIQCVRFDFNTIAPRDGTIYTCRMVRIYGFDGFFIELRVRDTEPKPKSNLLLQRVVDNICDIVDKFTKSNGFRLKR